MTLPSVFSATDRGALVARIRSLRPDAARQWGKMDPAQMLAHCRAALRVALGDATLRRGVLGLLFGGIARRSILAERPIPKGLPTDKTFLVRDRRDFAAERDGLIALVERLGTGGPAALAPGPHPFFGRLSVEQWDALSWKHLDHHLRQFGA